MSDLPLSTDYYRQGEHLAEMSELPCQIPGGRLILTEVPPLPEYLSEGIEELGMVDEWPGQTSFEAQLMLPIDGELWRPETLEITITQAERAITLASARALEAQLLSDSNLPGSAEVKVLCYPGEGMPAVLLAYLCLPEIGQVRLSASAATLLSALALLRRLLPEAQLP